MNRKTLGWIAGAVFLPVGAYLVQDAWASVSKVPILETKFEAIGQRLERIEDSLDMLIRLQIRRSGAEGTMVVCKDERGRVAACQEK